MKKIGLLLKEIFIKSKEFLKTYKKKIFKVVGVMVIIVIVGIGSMGGYKYYHAKSNMNYTQEQLEKVALQKNPGEVVGVDKKLNFRSGTFQYSFKIKDKDNMLQLVRVDSQYGTLVGRNGKDHKGHNGFMSEEGKGEGWKNDGRVDNRKAHFGNKGGKLDNKKGMEDNKIGDRHE